jgi:predicted phage terminase large subunit-like protein
MTSLITSLDQYDASSLLALQQAAERESLRRAAPASLISFTEFTFARYEAASIHRQIAQQLERVERGEIDRLMLLVPPRHSKSELASRRFPAWYMGKHPERHFISASASATLAEDFGRDVRNLIAGPEYAQMFDTRLAEDSQARGRWTTSEGGSYFACGVGGDLMGRGAHVVLIDDPFGSMRDARSEQQRKEVHSWYTGTVYNRLEKNGAIVLINHRMHQDDLSGRLLAQQAAGGDKWEVVELKAVSPDGVALWPEKFDANALARIKANITAHDWSALYLQAPAADEGLYFKEEWLRKVADDLPTAMNHYGASDLAVSADKGDYTVHVVIGVDHKNRMWLVDLWRKQASSGVWAEAYCSLVKRWKPNFWAHERTSIISAAGPFLEQLSRERQAWTNVEMFPTRGDKGARCQSIRGRMELSGLYVKANAPWLTDLVPELLAFPHGRHDDQVDALGLAGQLLDLVYKAHAPAKPEKDENSTGYQLYGDPQGDASYIANSVKLL